MSLPRQGGEGAVAVATDLSRRSDLAVERGARLAQRLGAELLLLHVVNDGLWATVTGMYDLHTWRGEEPPTAARQRLAEVAVDIGARFGIAAKTEIAYGRASVRIGEFAADRRLRLLVVGERGRSWVRDRVFLGGTALKVMEKAGVPVLLVRLPAATDHSRVLVATDFSAAAVHAARLALALSPAAHHTWLHAYAVEVEKRMRPGHAWQDFDALRDTALERAGRRMDAFAEEVVVPPSASISRQLVFDYPAAAILWLARKLDADLLAVGKHGGSALGERLLGSVTQNVLNHAECDVLLAP